MSVVVPDSSISDVAYPVWECWTKVYCARIGIVHGGGRLSNPTHYSPTRAGIPSASTCSTHLFQKEGEKKVLPQRRTYREEKHEDYLMHQRIATYNG